MIAIGKTISFCCLQLSLGYQKTQKFMLIPNLLKWAQKISEIFETEEGIDVKTK
jgi:hypothetical protein